MGEKDSSGDWRDGFLFLGNQLSLDFLNTRPVMDGAPVELLPDMGALRRWLAAAGLPRPRLVGIEDEMQPLREFRELLRKVVLDLEAGRAPSSAFVRKMNELLAAHPFVDGIVKGEDGLKRERRVEHAFSPILDAAADLITQVDRSKVRKCANCELHFRDTSKKGTRRWCSMQICGNRAKVAAYAERQRLAEQ
jgi:predicted RNA-binding Zn ribbon-like protein